MGRAGEHIQRVIAHLQEHGRTRSGALSAALGIEPAVLIAAVKLPIERGEIVKENEGRAVYYGLGDGTPPEAQEVEEDQAPEIRWTIWDDGDLVIYGLQENTDGSHTIPVQVLEAIKKRIAWTPAHA